MIVDKKLYEGYKAEAIEYRMYFGKAFQAQIDWLRRYIKKDPYALPTNIISSREAERQIRDKLSVIDAYEDCLSSSSTSFNGNMPNELKKMIIKAFDLEP